VLRAHAVRPIQTLSNMLAALREQDFSIRARGANTRSAMGLALHEVNALADLLRRERHESLEATALLRRVMDSIDVALFTFDDERRLRMVNREGEALLGRPGERVLGSEAAWLGLATALEGGTPRLLELTLPGRAGRWEVRRAEFRQEGRLHQLVVLSDLTRALRTEEREAWLRLIRVLSHEINNSLAPIQSIAASLRASATQPERKNREADLSEGLEVIEGRARSLARFMRAYVQFARLPAPSLEAIEIGPRARHAAALETRLKVAVAEGPRAMLQADADQLDQLLINLVRNAADAALEAGGGVSVSWRVANGWLELKIEAGSERVVHAPAELEIQRDNDPGEGPARLHATSSRRSETRSAPCSLCDGPRIARVPGTAGSKARGGGTRPGMV